MRIFFLIILGLIFVLPVSAQGLVPDCAGYTCTVCHVLLLISNIVRFLVVDLLAPLAGLCFLIGGIIMMASAGSEERYKKGKKVLVNTAIGAIIVLTSWLIVNTIITTFGNNIEGFSAENWWSPSVTCEAPTVKTGGTSNSSGSSAQCPPGALSGVNSANDCSVNCYLGVKDYNAASKCCTCYSSGDM